MLKEFNEFHKEKEEQRKTINEMVISLKAFQPWFIMPFKFSSFQAEKLSPEAKEAYEKISKLEKEKHEILHKLSESAQEELFALYKERRDKFPKPL